MQFAHPKRIKRKTQYYPWLFGLLFTGLVWFIGAYVAQVSTFTCTRIELGQQQGHCQLEEATLLMPWRKMIQSISLSTIQKATVNEQGVDEYAVVLLRNDNQAPLVLPDSPYQGPKQKIAARINEFLHNSKVRSLTIREGGGWIERFLLISFGGLGIVFASMWTVFLKRRHHKYLNQ